MRASHQVDTPKLPNNTHTHTHTPLSEQFTKKQHISQNPYSPQHPQYPSYLFSEAQTTVKSYWPWGPASQLALRPAHPGSPDPRPHEIARVFRSCTEPLEFKPGRIWFHKWDQLVVVTLSLSFRREQEGNCIDILLLACLHKLYIWHGGTKHNHETKKHHRQSPPLSNVSTCENKPYIYGGMDPRKASLETLNLLVVVWQTQFAWVKGVIIDQNYFQLEPVTAKNQIWYSVQTVIII